MKSEDCLNLNIWAPDNVQEKLPVVVYIHGGGWTYGANSQDTSDLSGLVASGKVMGVSINYRLGPLGWLELSQYGGKFKDAVKKLFRYDSIWHLVYYLYNGNHWLYHPINNHAK